MMRDYSQDKRGKYAIVSFNQGYFSLVEVLERDGDGMVRPWKAQPISTHRRIEALQEIIDGGIASHTFTSFAPSQDPLTFEAMMEAVSSLLPTPDLRPLRANAWTLNQLRHALMDSPGVRYAFVWPVATSGSVDIELDESLPDGVIKQGDKVLCSIRKDEHDG